ncbi:2-hydroxyacyl-CoA dehydratase family protein [Pseudonocardia zijingensis]|uniref:2-hydroxyacyl-CoA dehydratase n=1 Tax=Pseudonocardia zijingensis TaxID=153376 RepID=A0ABP4AFI9_9PSEU
MGATTLETRYGEAQAWPADLGVDASCVVCVGTNIPIELITASGFRAVPLVARPVAATPRADDLLESGYGAEFRSVLEQLLSGAADSAALVVFDRRFRDLYYYLKETVRLGWTPSLPPLHVFDLLLSRSVDCSAYNREQLRLLAAQLERSGGAAGPARLTGAIEAANAWRASVRTVLAQRRRGAGSGTAVFRALGAARVLDRESHRVQLDALHTVMAGTPAAASSGRPRIALFAAETLYHDRLHTAVESAGTVVVDEDSEWGSRLAGSDVDPGTDPAAALLAKYWADATGRELRPFDARSAFLRSVVDDAAAPDLVVVHVPPSDTRFGWDVPAMVRMCDAAGVPVAIVRSDVLIDDGHAEATTTVARALDRRAAG